MFYFQIHYHYNDPIITIENICSANFSYGVYLSITNFELKLGLVDTMNSPIMIEFVVMIVILWWEL